MCFQGFSAATIELTNLVPSETEELQLLPHSSLHNASECHLGVSYVSSGSRWKVHRWKTVKTSANSFTIRPVSVSETDRNSDPGSQGIPGSRFFCISLCLFFSLSNLFIMVYFWKFKRFHLPHVSLLVLGWTCSPVLMCSISIVIAHSPLLACSHSVLLIRLRPRIQKGHSESRTAVSQQRLQSSRQCSGTSKPEIEYLQCRQSSPSSINQRLLTDCTEGHLTQASFISQ